MSDAGGAKVLYGVRRLGTPHQSTTQTILKLQSGGGQHRDRLRMHQALAIER